MLCRCACLSVERLRSSVTEQESDSRAMMMKSMIYCLLAVYILCVASIVTGPLSFPMFACSTVNSCIWIHIFIYVHLCTLQLMDSCLWQR